MIRWMLLGRHTLSRVWPSLSILTRQNLGTIATASPQPILRKSKNKNILPKLWGITSAYPSRMTDFFVSSVKQNRLRFLNPANVQKMDSHKLL